MIDRIQSFNEVLMNMVGTGLLILLILLVIAGIASFINMVFDEWKQ